MDATASELPGDALRSYVGSKTNAALGVRGNELTWADETYLASNEYGDAYEGRALAWPESAESAAAEDKATLDISGDMPGGDGTVGGFFGTASCIVGDQLVITQTFGDKAVLAGPASLLTTSGTIDDLSSIMDGDPVSDGGQGYVGMGCATADDDGDGKDELVIVSYDGAIQHFTSDLEPDWWAAEEDQFGEGPYAFPGGRDITRWTYATRVNRNGSDIWALSYLSRTETNAITRLLDPASGKDVEEPLPGVFSIVTGTTEGGCPWTAYAILACASADDLETPDVPNASARSKPPSRADDTGPVTFDGLPGLDRGELNLTEDGSGDTGSDCDASGYVIVELRTGDDSVQTKTIALPIEMPYNCAPRLASDGKDRFGWGCDSGSTDGIAHVTSSP